MKKGFGHFFAYWIVLLVVFNVIAFVSVGWIWFEKYTPSFWIGYGFITLTFLIQLIFTYIAFRTDSASKLFYNMPLIKTSYGGLVLSFLVGGACMLLSPLTYWVAILACVIVFAMNISGIIKTKTAIDIVSAREDEVKEKTYFIKSMIIEAENLVGHVKSEEAKSECRKVFEAIRYSDPMSHEKLSDIETEIEARFKELKQAVEVDDIVKIQEISKKVLLLVEDRANKCKLYK